MKQTVLLIVATLMMHHTTTAQWAVVQCGLGIKAFDFVNDSTGYGLSNDPDMQEQLVVKTTDYGESWDTIYVISGALELQDISFPSEMVGYVCGGGMGHILKTTDGGENWLQQDISEVWEISTIEFENELDGYGGSTDGYNSFVETHDGGETWEYTLEMGFRDVSIFDDCDVSMVYGGGYYSNQNCIPWFTTYANFGDGTFSSIERVSPTAIFMGGLGWQGEITFNFGIIARSLDNGESWSFIEYPFLGTVNDMQFFGTDIGYAVAPCSNGNPVAGYQTIFLKTIDGGETWNYQEFINETTTEIVGAYIISCPSEHVCYASGSGCLFRTFNGGGELHPMPVSIDEIDMLELTISPNPATTTLTIQNLTTLATLKIFDTTGRLVMSEYNKQQIDVAYLPSGIYFIVVSTEEMSGVLRFVKE